MFKNELQKVAILFIIVICVISFFERKSACVESLKYSTIVNKIHDKGDGLSIVDYNSVNNKLVVCKTSVPAITFPHSEYVSGVFIPNKACLDRVDITDFMTDGGKITSGAYDRTSGVYYYTVYDDKAQSSRITASYLQTDYTLGEFVILNSEQAKNNIPEQSLYNMHVNQYDENNSTLYFSTDTWAQSRAIHAIKFKSNSSLVKLSEKFITDGDFVNMNGDNIVVNKIAHDDKGKYNPTYLVAPDGKEICQVDTRQQLWRVVAPCLPKGEVLKER